MGTEILYMDDIGSNYVREFEAVVSKASMDGSEPPRPYVILDRTAFYPEGGGQPSDVGTLRLVGDDGEPVPGPEGVFNVVHVVKKGNNVRHILDRPLPEETSGVKAVIDWDRRYAHMRMHTSQHIISAVVYDNFGAPTVGNQIHADRSRVDFHPVKFTDEDISEIERLANEIIDGTIEVEIRNRTRDSIEAMGIGQRCNLDLLPKFITELRVVTIGEDDLCPCAGTHVASTEELGHIRIIKKESKGKDKERITYVLE